MWHRCGRDGEWGASMSTQKHTHTKKILARIRTYNKPFQSIQHFKPSFINRRDLMCALQAHIHKIKCTTFICNEELSKCIHSVYVCVYPMNAHAKHFSDAFFSLKNMKKIVYIMHHLLKEKKFDGFLMFFFSLVSCRLGSITWENIGTVLYSNFVFACYIELTVIYRSHTFLRVQTVFCHHRTVICGTVLWKVIENWLN